MSFNRRSFSIFLVMSVSIALAFSYSLYFLALLLLCFMFAKQRILLLVLICSLIFRFLLSYSQYEDHRQFIGKEFRGEVKPLSISYGGKKGFFYAKKIKQKLFLRLKEPINLFHSYRVSGRLYRPKLNLNPKGFNQQLFAFQNATYLELICDSVEISGTIHSWRSHFFAYLYEKTEAYSESFRGILFAGTLGNKLFLSSADNQLFAKSGLSHFFALSGLHVGLIVFVIWSILSQLSRSFWLRFSLISFFLVAYVLLVGVKAPIFRASIMSLLYLYGRYRFHFMDSFHLLWISAIINLSIFPFDLFHLSFWLSYSALFSILYALKRVRQMDSIYAFTRDVSVLKKFLIYATALLSPYIGTMPIIYAIFGQVSLSSIPNNLLLILPLTALLYGLLLFIFLSSFSDALAGILALFLDQCIAWIKGILEFTTSIEAVYNTGDFLLFTSFFLVGLILMHLRKIPLRNRFIYSFCVMVISYYYKNDMDQNYLHIRLFDLGQAQAVLISNQNKHLLYDAGKSLKKRLSPYNELNPILKRVGVDSLDLVIISHQDFDHYGNLKDLNYRFIENSPYEKDSLYMEKITLGEAKLFHLKSLRKWRNKNDASLVYKLTFGEVSCLLTGDIQEKREKELVDLYGDFLKSDILLVPHHGSKSSSSKAFVDRVSSKCSLISLALRNSYGHPDSLVLKRLSKSEIIRTDIHSYRHLISNGKEIFQVPALLEAIIF